MLNVDHFDEKGCTTRRHILYCACTWSSCRPQDKPSGSKNGHVEGIAKN